MWLLGCDDPLPDLQATRWPHPRDSDHDTIGAPDTAGALNANCASDDTSGGMPGVPGKLGRVANTGHLGMVADFATAIDTSRMFD